MHARLFILEKNAALHGLIRHCTLIHFRKCGLHVSYLDHFQYVDLYASLYNFFPYATCIKTPIRVKLSSPCETRWTSPHCLKCMVIGLAHFYLGKQALYGSYNLYNKGKTRNLERDGIILAEFGSTRRFVDLLRWTH